MGRENGLAVREEDSDARVGELPIEVWRKHMDVMSSAAAIDNALVGRYRRRRVGWDQIIRKGDGDQRD